MTESAGLERGYRRLLTMGLPTDGHLAVLYLPPLLLLAGIMILACTGQRPGAVRQPWSA